MDCLVLTRKDKINTIEKRKFNRELTNDPTIPWIHLNVENRAVFSEFTPTETITSSVLDRLQQPGKSFLVKRFGDIRILDCNINYELENSVEHQLTFLFFSDKVLTITTAGNVLSDNLRPEDLIEPDREYDANLVILTIFRRMLDKNTSLASSFAKKVDRIMKHSIANAFDTPTDELEELHSLAIDLNELFEDQLTTVRLLPINIEEDNLNMAGFFDRIEKSMEYLVNITERSQAKLDYILQRYANVLQQKANARLNTLTIVQAIFVPLTFLAGIYGMNFVNMPELEAANGYFYVLGIMVFLGVGGIYLFYRNGWFKSN